MIGDEPGNTGSDPKASEEAVSQGEGRRCPSVSLAVKPVGEPDAGNPHVRFDERGWETGRSPATAPNLDSTEKFLKKERS